MLPYLTLPSVEIVNSRQVLSGSVPMLVSSIAEEGVKLTVHVQGTCCCGGDKGSGTEISSCVIYL